MTEIKRQNIIDNGKMVRINGAGQHQFANSTIMYRGCIENTILTLGDIKQSNGRSTHYHVIKRETVKN